MNYPHGLSKPDRDTKGHLADTRVEKSHLTPSTQCVATTAGSRASPGGQNSTRVDTHAAWRPSQHGPVTLAILDIRAVQPVERPCRRKPKPRTICG